MTEKRKINWKDKTKPWEVTLMLVAGVLVLVQGTWMFGAMAGASSEHEDKLKAIQNWKDASLATAMRATASINGLGDIDREVLSWLSEDFSNENQEIQGLAADWNILKFRRCVEVMPFITNRKASSFLMQLMNEKAGIKAELESSDALYHALWKAELTDSVADPTYGDFKAVLYRAIDPRFSEYFGQDKPKTINLSEVRWGGVGRDGIPPLRKPKMLKSVEAKYLKDTDVVFGFELNGDVRAYPKRILAWHEMFTDEVGGVPIAGVYCTLCGTMIPYDCRAKGATHQMGTSGFLYRSNKLMYDAKTKSLWSTTAGEPVVGTLVGQGVKLQSYPVVTTTWGHWKSLHPETTVLSLDTGYSRDYGEGIAYHDYFSTDELMFTVQSFDHVLRNKSEVLVLPWANNPKVSISAELLKRKPLYQTKISDKSILVVTDSTGANRVYLTGVDFAKQESETKLLDKSGRRWNVTEDKIQCISTKVKAPRLAAHRAFWFGWHAAYPNGQLIVK